MTYHVHHVILAADEDEDSKDSQGERQPPQPKTDRAAAWLNLEEVGAANVGTGVKKVWAAVYSAWGKADKAGKMAKAAKATKATKVGAKPTAGGKPKTEAKTKPKAEAKPTSKSGTPATGKGKANGTSMNGAGAKREPDQAEPEHEPENGGKRVKRVRMPAMPQRKPKLAAEVDVKAEVDVGRTDVDAAPEVVVVE